MAVRLDNRQADFEARFETLLAAKREATAAADAAAAARAQRREAVLDGGGGRRFELDADARKAAAAWSVQQYEAREHALKTEAAREAAKAVATRMQLERLHERQQAAAPQQPRARPKEPRPAH